MSIHKKVQEAFSSASLCFYLRKDVITKITNFLRSKKDFILHLTGNPGCGKTSITKFMCQDQKHIFLNSYIDDVKKKILQDDKINLWIVDEFDKIKDYKFILNYIKTNKKKLITLSNSLNMEKTLEGITISIKPYTSKDIESILKLKCKEVGKDILSDFDIKVISKMFGKSGDMRLIFNYVRDHFDKNSEKIVLQNEKVENEDPPENNFQHKIIKEVVSGNFDRRKAYSVYSDKCEELGIPRLYRNDFYAVFDMFNT